MSAAPSLALVPAEKPIPSPVQPYVEANPASVLLQPEIRDAFFAEIAAEISGRKVELGTKKGRDEIKSLAYKVSLTKAPIKKAAEALTEDFKRRAAAITSERDGILEKLDGLRDRARAPLDEWETKDKERREKVKETLDFLAQAERILATDTSKSVNARIASVEAIEDIKDFHDARERTMGILAAASARFVKEEAYQAELAQLRAEADERKRQEAEREKAEQEKIAAKRRELDAKEAAALAEKAAQERIATAARLAAEEAIAAERRRTDELAAEAKRVADVEIAKLATEKLALEQAEAVRIAEAKRQADEDLARQKNRQHRANVMTAAKVAIMKAGSIDEATAKEIVKAMVAGQIPNVTVNF